MLSDQLRWRALASFSIVERTGSHLESGDDVVILEGTVEEATDKRQLKRLIERYKAKYKIDPPLLDPSTINYRLVPKKAFGWRETSYPKSATRWVFEGGT